MSTKFINRSPPVNIFIYILAAACGLFLSYIGIVFSMLGGSDFSNINIGLLAFIHIGTFIFVIIKAKQGKGRQVAFVLSTPMFMLMVYKALRPGSEPRFDTINRVCTALRVRLVAQPLNATA